ncbi:MAG: GxxExxY protein [Candidatus Aminicenantes bacterium]|nr:GxxExxY protein [Candidatus Aminicenantes bacterium]
MSDKIKQDIIDAARRVYETLGAGHEEAIYRDAMSVELQDRGYTVKTEMPVSIKYETSQGKSITVGSAKVDVYIEKGETKAILELKASSPLIKEKSKKTKEEMKEYAQLQKYLASLGLKGFLINFPFPPKEEPEVIE